MGRTKWTAAQQRAMLDENCRLWLDSYKDEVGGTYVGIDFSLRSTGVVLLNSDGEYEDSTALSTKAKDGTNPQRIKYITDGIKPFIADSRPSVISVEAINVGTHHSSLVSNSRVSGAVYQLIFDTLDPVPYMLFANVSSLKTAATSDVKSKKSHMLLEVFDKWGEKMDTDDEADAFVAAKLGYKVDKFFECYHDIVLDSDQDMYNLLLDIGKNRHEGLYKSLKEEGVDRNEVDALIGIFTGNSGGGSGLNQLKKNDKDFYYAARTRLKEV